MAATTTWAGTLEARSSIVHAGESRGTITLLRREAVITPEGALVQVPVISGNTLRGRLRRVGEELLREALGYDGLIHPAAAHALRGGGALAKTSAEPLSGSRLATLRALVPQVAVFGAAGGGTIIDGALAVGKVIPHVAETNRITGAGATRSAFAATQLEGYTHARATGDHDGPTAAAEPGAHTGGEAGVGMARGSGQMLFHVETFPAGTTFSTHITLRRPTELELAFFTEVLATWCADARLGGRLAIGHGRVVAHLVADPPPQVSLDWRAHLTGRREQVLDAIASLR